MKLWKYLCLPLLLTLSMNVSFATTMPNKMVMLPFKNVPLFSKTHTGIFFNYDMYSVPKRNVVCQLSHVYKSWLEFPREGGVDETPTYGGDQTVILTSNEKEKRANHSEVLRADRAGTVKIFAVKQGKRSNASVSCYYQTSEIG